MDLTQADILARCGSPFCRSTHACTSVFVKIDFLRSLDTLSLQYWYILQKGIPSECPVKVLQSVRSDNIFSGTLKEIRQRWAENGDWTSVHLADDIFANRGKTLIDKTLETSSTNDSMERHIVTTGTGWAGVGRLRERSVLSVCLGMMNDTEASGPL